MMTTEQHTLYYQMGVDYGKESEREHVRQILFFGLQRARPALREAIIQSLKTQEIAYGDYGDDDDSDSHGSSDSITESIMAGLASTIR